MFSENAKKNADACRFCWMCRHLCPLGNVTGKETNNPRPKGLMISLVERGENFSREMAEDMYECCLCESCTNDCATGFEPPVFIREARTQAVVHDLVPARVKKMIDSVMDSGNIYSLDAKDMPAELTNEINKLPETAKVVLHLGDTAAYKEPGPAIAAIKLLKKANVDFTVIKDEMSSWVELGDLIGFVNEVKELAKKTTEQIKAIGAETLVVLNPSSARMFKQQYAGWGLIPAKEIVTATSYLDKLIKDKKLNPEKLNLPKVTFHDPCRLARDLDETQPSRDILSSMGLELSEMFYNKKFTKCCGGEVIGGHSPNLSALTSERRWGDVERAGARMLITACPGCAHIMGKNVPNGMLAEDIFVLLSKACEA